MGFILTDGITDLTIEPEYDFKDSGSKVESRHRTRDGSEFVYKWGSFDTIEFSVKYVLQAFKTTVNDWWLANTDLVWLINTANLFEASYDSKNYDISSEDTSPCDVAISFDGTKMYILGDANSNIFQYTLATPGNVDTATYDSVFLDTFAEASNVRGIAFSADGATLYTVSLTTDTVYQYSLTEAWNLDTASYSGKSFLLTSETFNPISIEFNVSKSKMYVLGSDNDEIYQYTLATPGDVDTASYDNVFFDIAGEVEIAKSLRFNFDNSIMFILDDGSPDSVFQYTLSTPEDLSTAEYDKISLDVSSEETDFTFGGMNIDTHGSKLYIVGSGNDIVYQYSIGEKIDVRLTNRSKPIDKVIKPYDDLFSGKIKLSTY